MIYRFSQIFAVVGVLLWFLRIAIDLSRQVLQWDRVVRARARLNKWSAEFVAQKLPSNDGPRSWRHLFLH
jgi:hypothetical protein